jgi:hypothetical protein
LLLGVLLAVPLRAQGQPARGAALPPGHPSTVDREPDDDEPAMPPGHPTAPSGQGAPAKEGTPGIFDPPADTETEDASLPKGTIVVEIRGAENDFMPGVDVSLGILHQSVAKGESREHKAAPTDDKGAVRFDDLETGSGVAYRVTVGRDGATFAALPFQLPALKGMHVVLHVYAVSRDIQHALIVLQGIFFVEVKDDRLQIEQIYTIFNVGKIAWLPEDVVIKLPEKFTALSAQQSMSDQGLDTVDKVGARLHGTFAPGRHELSFHWQIPYAGERNVDFDVGLPPHVAVMRAMAGAAGNVKFSVVGFPDAEAKNDMQGQRVLVTERQARQSEPWSSLHVKLEGLPTPGPGRIVATGLAGLTVTVGLLLAFAGGGKPGRASNEKGRRAKLLSDLLDLERARKAGDVGPKTYERARRDIIDSLARTLDLEGEKPTV